MEAGEAATLILERAWISIRNTHRIGKAYHAGHRQVKDDQDESWKKMPGQRRLYRF